MVFLDPQLLPERFRKVVTFRTKSDRGRKRLGIIFMLLAIVTTLDASGLLS